MSAGVACTMRSSSAAASAGRMAAHRLVAGGLACPHARAGRLGPAWSPQPGAGRHDGVHASATRKESAYRATTRGGSPKSAACSASGGPSVFYGGVSFRFREEDFTPDAGRSSAGPEPRGRSGTTTSSRSTARPSASSGSRATTADDPTRPPRRDPYPFAPAQPLARGRSSSGTAARELGPAAVPVCRSRSTSRARNGRRRCELCRTCDTYVCAVEAKNDTGVAVVRPLLDKGLESADQRRGHEARRRAVPASRKSAAGTACGRGRLVSRPGTSSWRPGRWPPRTCCSPRGSSECPRRRRPSAPT